MAGELVLCPWGGRAGRRRRGGGASLSAQVRRQVLGAGGKQETGAQLQHSRDNSFMSVPRLLWRSCPFIRCGAWRWVLSFGLQTLACVLCDVDDASFLGWIKYLLLFLVLLSA